MTRAAGGMQLGKSASGAMGRSPRPRMCPPLMHGQDGQWRADFPKLLAAFRAGKPTSEAFATAYPGLDLNKLEGALKAHVRFGRPPPHQDIPDAEMRVVFERLEQLPYRQGHGDFYPAQIVAARQNHSSAF